ncbi:MAG: AAA family ATPase [Candidatus Marsarchaeota archaeon]|nr:AAA family ATPase [Candidatus Marsarchaeota archaeon]
MSEKAGARGDKGQKKSASRLNFEFKKHAKEPAMAKRPYRLTVPLAFYWVKDIVRQLFRHKNFPDSVAVSLAMISVAIAFPSLPVPILLVLVIMGIVLTMLNPLLGLMVLLFSTLPMFIYQAPLLGWMSTILVSAALFLGYRHYRTITFIYVMAMLPLSVMGSFLEIPGFILGTLFIGFKRSVVSAVAIIFIVAVFSGLTGIQDTGPIVYNAAAAHLALGNSPAVQYLTPSKPALTLSNAGSGFAEAIGTMFSYQVSQYILASAGLAASVIGSQFELIGMQVVVWLLAVFAISNYAVKRRSAYKGAESSLFGILIPVAYALLSYAAGLQINPYVLVSFAIAPLTYFALEYNGIDLVRTLDVVKRDFLGKFSDSVEELTSGAKETLDDVANYAHTKDELRDAILAPMEHREIAGAYNVKPARGILLFGPPGTGKTLIMRALSNEIRGRFFYVKSSSLISPYQGESSNKLSQIFIMARKHTPAILFFDEIDGLASSRELKESDEARQLLSVLLGEMDGFQKMEGVVIVGSTNMPNLLDPGITRPGRFDKIIYMKLPDENGRAEIFRLYLKKLPTGSDVDFAKLAKLSNRYSGADIKNVCDEVARSVSEDAIKTRKVLEITMGDIVPIIRQTKPSTTLSQLEMYATFQMDYERRMHPEKVEESAKGITIDDVVGLGNAKKAVYEAIEIPMLHPDLVRKYDVADIKGILLFGPPGVGKTMLMRAVASEISDVRVLTLSGAEVSKYGIEKAMLTIKQVFDRARENEPAVIFIDEIDSLLPSRSQTGTLGAGITSEFLQQMDGIKELGNIVVVGATNKPDDLDPALLRGGRFDKLIFVGPPEKEARAELFRRNLAKAPCADDIDYNRLAEVTSGYTGADIANMCRQIKLNAMERSISKEGGKAEITMEEAMGQINATRPSAPALSLSNYLNFLSRYGRN